jgi:hypothetical protein
MPDEIGRVCQTRAVMPGDAMEKHRLPARVGHQVGCLAHLLQGRSRSAHRDQDPVHAGVGHNLCLRRVLAIAGIDVGERKYCLDMLAGDDRPQRFGLLPGAPHQTTRHDRQHSLFSRDAPVSDDLPANSERQCERKDRRHNGPERTIHAAGFRKIRCRIEVPAAPLPVQILVSGQFPASPRQR